MLSALKLSRTLLSTTRDSLQLWAAHAQLERLRGKENEARRIFETVLSSSSSPRLAEARLWWIWAEMEWLADQDKAAQLVILRSVGILSGGPTNILKAKRLLEERTVSEKDWKDREAWICLLALLDILLSPRGLEEAMRRLRRYIEENSLEGVQRESAWVRILLFAWKHSVLLKRQLQRNKLRGFFEEGVIDMERGGRMNSVILGTFLESEKGKSVWGRTRALTGESGLSGRNQSGRRADAIVKGLKRRIWEVWLPGWEQTDWKTEKERIRSSLATAVADPRQIRCIFSERTTINLKLGRGHRPFYGVSMRSLRFDAKNLKRLKKLVFKATELGAWADTMVERGIRLHHGLEEYIGATGRESSPIDEGEGEGEGEGEDILEKDAEDYRRLAPF
ncbi:hypothetical protein Clacol_008160 [Clathrus columnatus]|uniref:Uncharacterized protein n=1 Tax=Clathrus columnatus TaxID=1419009 RepID=A0AAV5AMI5_9AGAM|nr:hypothetical protein Clacol_008160 [Clathrus columnatus]